MSLTDWNARWMDRALHLASWSKDPSTKVACVLVRDQHAVGEGYNGFPHGVNDSDARLLERATKYDWTIHAEANAVAHAARFGHSTLGATAFVTFPPCPTCTTLLLQAGIRALVVKMPGCDRCDQGVPRVYSGTEKSWLHAENLASPHGYPLGEQYSYCSVQSANPDEWVKRFDTSREILREAGVPVAEL